MKPTRTSLLMLLLAAAFLLGRPVQGTGAPDPDYPHGTFEEDCTTCHSPEAWKPASFSKDFDHAAFGTPLEGAHAQTACLSCHRTLEFADTGTRCGDCHQDIHQSEMGPECADCHTTRSFGDRARVQARHQVTRFPLTGAHSTLDCESCHGGSGQGHLSFVGTASECASCHTNDYQATQQPPHALNAFSTECTLCHGTSQWDGAVLSAAGLHSFDHGKGGFPLSGAHARQECMSCHGDGTFAGKSTECASCHQADYNGTTDPNHATAGFGLECATCHGMEQWRGAVFDHNRTDFALTGSHVEQECRSCHGGGVYSGLSTQCASCHQADYDNTDDPDHAAAGYPLECATCHGTTQWDDAVFDHNRTDFALTGSHVEQECRSCHGGGVYNGLSTQCASCHQADYDGTTDPNHALAGFGVECATCHGTTQWNGAVFDHNRTDFALTGSHVEQECRSCHGGGVYNGLSTQCASCHQADYDGTDDPNHSAAGYPLECETCHNTGDWEEADFDHNQTQFALTGSHIEQECRSCHGGGVFDGLSMECATCHQADYDDTDDPNHALAGFALECATCHGTTDWDGATFDHAQTQFALTGSHVEQQCASCHGGGVYDGLSMECASCHQADYNATTDPNHVAAGYPSDCKSCHGTAQWDGATFDHNQTQFALTGSHIEQECASCHGGGVYDGLATECASCHQVDYNSTTDPAHAAAGFALQCETCHNTTQWDGATFDHSQTQFALTGSHIEQECASCHGGGVYNGLSMQCASCHQADYNSTTDPNHAAAGYPLECETCHGTAQWDGATFDHNQTLFPLTGSHVVQECLSCHGGGVYDGLATECASCHQADYNSTTDPDHAAAGFALQCETCHNTTQWDGATFDHSQTQFVLTGSHIEQECASCHGGGVFDGLATECASCHQANYNSTTDPSHVQAGFALQCETCHGTAQWDGATFDHDQTRFALTGSHIEQQCASCHGGGVFDGLATECASCHQPDYDGTTDPNHAAAGYPLDCQICHGTAQWDGADFDHAQTLFPLAGSHIEQECRSCHGGGVFDGLATECASCHQPDYDTTTDPDHAAAGFALECQTCHNTTQWDGANFDHNQTQFALTGSHIEQQCASCHGGGVYDGLATECASCHQPDYDGTTDPNHATAGYSTLCETCHGTTQWEGAVFDHSRTDFPLTGSHLEQECLSCHSGGVYNGLSTQCASCHQPEYDGTTDPDHAAAGFPVSCQSCHNTTTWLGATFNHSQTQFPLTGSHIEQECRSCHGGGVYNGLSMECASCHQSDYNGTTDPNHATAGFPLQCETCHGTSTWLGAVFDHNQSQFPLTGAHLAVECMSCHSGGVYDGLPTECASCHQPDFDGTTNPNHTQAGFPATCQTCHNTTAWLGATFDHTQTLFPLTGSHVVQECLSCHGGGVYDGLSTQCASCHQSDYDGTTDPNHTQAGFPVTCQTCHNTTQWLGATFNHSQTQFPLTGSHIEQECRSCHGGGVYNGLSMECASCHQSDYNGTTDPNHATAGFPLQCETCHGTSTWLGAVFDHNQSQFPLTGAHLAVECMGCHGGGIYNGLATECASCHQADYNGTTNPNHTQAGFSLQCQTCHTTTAWPGATFNHSQTSFPLTGSHVQQECMSCHSSGIYNGLNTQCASCHQADYNGTTDPSHVGAGFPLQCETCHNTTTWQGATFDHDSQNFPIYSGKHRDKWDLCTDCHTNSTNYSVFTCLSCHPHSDKAKTDSDHQGRSGYRYDSAACYNCHPRGDD